jgi:hypothetical protein
VAMDIVVKFPTNAEFSIAEAENFTLNKKIILKICAFLIRL